MGVECPQGVQSSDGVVEPRVQAVPGDALTEGVDEGARYGSGDGDPWGPAWGSGPGVSRSMAVEPSEPVGEGGPAGGGRTGG